jgi:hypothetical protein
MLFPSILPLLAGIWILDRMHYFDNLLPFLAIVLPVCCLYRYLMHAPQLSMLRIRLADRMVERWNNEMMIIQAGNREIAFKVTFSTTILFIYYIKTALLKHCLS